MPAPWSSFLDRFLQRAAERPEAIALVSAGAPPLRYRDLVDEVQRLAAALHARGVGREAVVALGVGRSREFVVGVLAAWWVGAAFVPIDPALPPARRAALAAESGARVIATTPGQRECFHGLDIPILAIGSESPCGTVAAAEDCPDDLAYLIFTSGSTGQPKGVLVEQRGLVAVLDAQITAFDLRPGDRALWMLSPSFDASLSDVGTALLAGATLVVAPPEVRDPEALVKSLTDHAITHVDLPPALLPLLDPGRAPASLRTVVIGGEVCPPDAVRRWVRTRRVVNVYGPTEATICASLCVCDPERWEEPLLGRPFGDIRYHILDERLRPAAEGEVGELCIEGPCVARGYLGRPDLTAAKFPIVEGQRLYRTGDRVRRRADGEYVFHGRLDRQIKLRGKLVEPAEVEACLTDHPGVRTAGVVARKLGARTGLVAFVEPAGAYLDVDSLRQHLSARLPDWMIPARIVRLETLPRTASGKIDLRLLAEMMLPGGLTASGLEGLLRETLGGSIDWGATFLAQGGDSLALLQFVTSARARGVTLSPALLAERPLAEALAASQRQDDALPAARLREDVEAILHEYGLPRTRAVPAGRPRRILLTGATGFLGSYLLAELLARTDAEVECLVRCRDPEEGRARLGVSSPRVHIIPGDLTRPRFGLPEAAWQELAGRVEAIYHSAARVHLLLPYDRLRPDNVLGTAEILRLAADGPPKRLHHVSTLSVFVATDRNAGVLLESDRLEKTGRVFGGYAQSKWAAEWLVHRAGSAAVYRPGLITGDSRSGKAAVNDFLALFLCGLSRLGCYPDRDADALFLDVTPVDYAAAALVHLSLTVEETTYHLAGGRWSLADLVAGLSRQGVALNAVSLDSWQRRLAALEHLDPQSAAACLALCRGFADRDNFARYRTMDLFQATGVTFDTRNTGRGLAGSGIPCPEATPELLDRYIRHTFPPQTPP